jgi:hypothetical protein
MSYAASHSKAPTPGPYGKVARLNERGNEIRRAFYLGRDISHYEDARCRESEGWYRFATHQDASWHGIFVNPERKEVITFCEGGESHVICHTTSGYRAELRYLVEHFGVLLPPALAPKKPPRRRSRSPIPLRALP